MDAFSDLRYFEKYNTILDKFIADIKKEIDYEPACNEE